MAEDRGYTLRDPPLSEARGLYAAPGHWGAREMAGMCVCGLSHLHDVGEAQSLVQRHLLAQVLQRRTPQALPHHTEGGILRSKGWGGGAGAGSRAMDYRLLAAWGGLVVWGTHLIYSSFRVTRQLCYLGGLGSDPRPWGDYIRHQ
jgi:hypothetical protein